MVNPQMMTEKPIQKVLKQRLTKEAKTYTDEHNTVKCLDSLKAIPRLRLVNGYESERSSAKERHEKSFGDYFVETLINSCKRSTIEV
jgi:hypothetical protein